MHKLIFATRNRGKIKEVRNIFYGSGFEIMSLLELDSNFDIEENESTFEGNAKKKAVEVFEKFKLPVISDDSGIEVLQLNGIPGVHSARYSGENATDEGNNLKLLRELKKYPEPHPARYVCYAIYYDGDCYLAERGEINGRIIMNPRGTNGFGYDPLFLPDGYVFTMAELSPRVKNSISHRGKAFNKLKEKIKTYKESI